MQNTELKLVVDACSRQDIENPEYTSLLPGKWFVISIYTPGGEPAEVAVNDTCRGILLLCFDDLDEPQNEEARKNIKVRLGRSADLFRPEWAEGILKTLDGFGKNLDTVIVHCDAGISRSAAIAAGICKYIGKSDDRFFRTKVPNRFVYRTMLEQIEEHELMTPGNPSYYRQTVPWTKEKKPLSKKKKEEAKVQARQNKKHLLEQSRSATKRKKEPQET